MRVAIKCFATLRDYAPPGAEAFPVSPGETPRSLIARLGIPADEVRIVFVNGVHATPDTALADGDRVGLFPAVGGG